MPIQPNSIEIDIMFEALFTYLLLGKVEKADDLMVQIRQAIEVKYKDYKDLAAKFLGMMESDMISMSSAFPSDVIANPDKGEDVESKPAPGVVQNRRPQQ